MNESTNMTRFRESFRGYNKDDVNSYIEQLNIRFTHREADLKAKISELEEKAVNDQKSVSATDNNTLSSDNSKDATAELEARISELTTENNRLKSELENMMSKSGDETINAEKSKLYDSMSSQVGNILIVANSNADKIVTEAREESIRIRSEAVSEAEKIKSDAEKSMNELVNTLKVRLAETSERCISDYTGLIGEASKRFCDITDGIKNSSDMITAKAVKNAAELEQNINDDFRRISSEDK